MNSRPYRIASDPKRRLITITFDSVFWDAGVAERFRAECVAAVASLRCVPGTHLVLVDLRNAVLQSQEIFDKMQALIGTATASRIALVAATPLARMQTKRLQIRDTAVMFADMADAEAWLFAEESQAA